jgi:hypothetical protein
MLRLIARRFGSTTDGLTGRAATCVGIAAYFQVPGQMKAPEILSRSSASVIRSASGRSIVLAAGHVLRPHRFKKVYPGSDWLDFVQDSHITLQLEVRPIQVGAAACGASSTPLPDVLATVPLLNSSVVLHSKRDVGRVDPVADDELDKVIDAGLVNLDRLGGERAAGGARMVFFGLEVADSGLETETIAARTIDGATALVAPMQTFVRTEQRLPQGFCGGPAVDLVTGEVLGVVEGIVLQAPVQDKELKALIDDTAVIVEGPDLAELMKG